MTPSMPSVTHSSECWSANLLEVNTNMKSQLVMLLFKRNMPLPAERRSEQRRRLTNFTNLENNLFHIYASPTIFREFKSVISWIHFQVRHFQFCWEKKAACPLVQALICVSYFDKELIIYSHCLVYYTAIQLPVLTNSFASDVAIWITLLAMCELISASIIIFSIFPANLLRWHRTELRNQHLNVIVFMLTSTTKALVKLSTTCFVIFLRKELAQKSRRDNLNLFSVVSWSLSRNAHPQHTEKLSALLERVLLGPKGRFMGMRKRFKLHYISNIWAQGPLPQLQIWFLVLHNKRTVTLSRP